MEKIVIFQQFAGFEDLFKKFGARDDVPDLVEDDIPHPVAKAFEAAPVAAARKSANGASIVFDLALPPADDVDTDGEFWKMPKVVLGVSAALKKTSDAAFVKVLAEIRRVFAGHEEEYEQAIQLVTKIRAEARAAAIAMAAAQ